MILRGAATGVVTSGAGGAFGLSVTDPARPDLAPSRPAYARVTGESYDTPHPPAFLSVTASGGRLQVTVHSEAPADGYQIGISATSYEAPTVWWNTSSGSIDQEQTGGPWYLWARATYLGAFSLWSIYGQVRPEDEEWRLTWADEAMDGADVAAYDYATVAYGHTSGFRFLKRSGYTPWIHQYCSYVDAFGLSLLPAVGGPKGTRIDTRLVIGAGSAKLTGVAFGFDRTAMQSAPTSTAYYGLALRMAGGDENYAKYLGLYHVLDQTATLIAEANVTSLMTSRPYAGGRTLCWVDVSVQARQNSFQVTAKGQLVLNATDTTIPWTDTKVGAGLWYQGSSDFGYTLTYYMNTGLEDYLRVYARHQTGEAETVTPGAGAHNDLDGRTQTACHPASAVTVTPSGAIAATDVQAAINELDTEKAAVGHTHVLDDLTDVTITDPVTDNILKFNGTTWVNGTGGGGAVHNDLTGRDATDAHPMAAITGLTDALASKVQPATTQTVNLTNSMTTAEIQQKINYVSKYIPYGSTVTFQFGDGTYTLNAALTFSGFFGGGTVVIQGNTTETDAAVLHTSQQVHLNFSGTDCHGVQIQYCRCYVAVKNLKISTLSGANNRVALQCRYCSSVDTYYCYLTGTSSSLGGHCLDVIGGTKVYALRNYVALNTYGIYTGDNGECYSYQNDDVAGSSPVTGLFCTGGQIRVYSTQPSGSTADSATLAGGKIWDDSTVWTSSNDGSGSGLDAGLLCGVAGSGYCLWAGALASAPTAAEGKIYYNTTDAKTYIYANAGWKALT